MYPFISLGPLSLPTMPFVVLVAGWLGLSVAARAGARQSLDPDHVLTTGLIALAAGVIVARLWHVVQFWSLYLADPLLALSPRPGGLAFWPGFIAALIAGYAYLLHKELSPVKIAASFAIGVLVAEALLQVGGFLTGTVLGLPSDLPWALSYFGERLHPVALYRAAGALLLAIGLFVVADFRRPGRVVLQAALGYALVRLVSDAFLADAVLIGMVRASQVMALVVALLAALLLAQIQNDHDPDVVI